jgi:DNA-binding HxlR family transcriptional regulator
MEPAGGYCPVYDAISVLQEKWTLHIVRALLRGPLGFNELGRAVGGCNPATLKTRLDRLEELGLVTRSVQSYMPPRTSYELAEAGDALRRVIDAIDEWARAHLPAVRRACTEANATSPSPMAGAAQPVEAP